MKKQPRGLRNNNPLNIRHSKDLFQGEVHGTDNEFKTFKSPEYGYRAAFVLLKTYLTVHKCDTITKIITRWAPPSENSTLAYIYTVSKLSGIDENEPLTASDSEKYIKIAAAMSYMENGIVAVRNDVLKGFELQTGLK